MEEIKVNDFVRTKQGYIAKCVEVDEDVDYYTFDEFVQENYGDKYSSLCERELEDIVKHSSNIIDLIEVGDFVNGRLVLQVDYKNKNVCLLIPLTDTKANTNIMWYGYEDIKTVVTKEQFANAEYRLEE